MRQCIYAHWLEDSVNGLKNLDNKVIEVYKKMNKEDINYMKRFAERAATEQFL